MDVAAPVSAAHTAAHKVRANVLENEVTWHLGPDGLERVEEGTPGARTALLPYASVTGIRLSYAPSRVDAKRYRCDIAFGGSVVKIFSTHYAGIAEFEDRAVTYVALVRGLIARVAAANPSATFRSGKRPLIYLLEHAFLFAMFALLVLVLALVGGAAFSDLVLIKLGLIIVYLPIAFVYMRKNWPRTFKPDAIPEEMLPPVNRS